MNAFDFPEQEISTITGKPTPTAAQQFAPSVALINYLKTQAPMLFPSEMERIAASSPQQRRAEVGQEAMGLVMPMFTKADVMTALPKDVYQNLVPYLKLMEERGTLEGTGQFTTLPLSTLRGRVQSPTATGATMFPSLDVAVAESTPSSIGALFGKAISEKEQAWTTKHELGHLDVRNISREQMGFILDKAKSIGFKVPELKYIKENWNPRAYNKNEKAKNAEEFFVNFMEKQSADDLKDLLGTFGKISKKETASAIKLKEPKAGDFVSFTDSTGKLQKGKVRDYDSYSKQVEIFPEDSSLVQDPNRASIAVPVNKLVEATKMKLSGKEGIPEVKGLKFNGVQEIPGRPNQYVFSVTEPGKESTFYTTDLSKKSLAANRDRILKAYAEAEKKKLIGKEATTSSIEGENKLRNIETAGYPKAVEEAQGMQEQFADKLEKRGINADDFFLATVGLPQGSKMRLLSDLVGKKEAMKLLKEVLD